MTGARSEQFLDEERGARRRSGSTARSTRAGGEHDSGEHDEARLRSLTLARSSGATFAVGVAAVGLLSVRAAAGRVQEALTAYREVID
ncbi:MAG: hypothetical protein M3235_02815 [Actinomycetota bacterium]|nr:hypothetical protein [Actinomycetota bacterium]